MLQRRSEPAFYLRERGLWLLFVLLVCAFCGWVLSMPTFPTEDGPIHLYFATVLSDLLSHSSPLYAHYYYIHHLLPPYSVHYYVLIALMKIMSAPMAEKIVICIIFCTFAFGFRYLATGIGEAGEVFSLLIIALLLNWPLGMGFENFSLSMGLSCWALGLWTRLQSPQLLSRSAVWYRIGFVCVLAFMTLTHPLPVVLVVGFVFLDTVVRAVANMAWKTSESQIFSNRHQLLGNLLTLAVGGATLGYIYLFTDEKRIEKSPPHHIDPVARFLHFARLNGIAYFGGHTLGAHLYRLSLHYVLILALCFGLWAAVGQARTRVWTSSLSWMLAALILLPAMCLLPDDVSGSHFVTDRLVITIWIAMLAAASGTRAISRPVRAFVAWSVVAIAILDLGMGQTYVRPDAKLLAQMERAPVVETGMVGLLLPADAKKYGSGDHLQFYPFIWGGTYYFRRTGSVMLNTPWMDVSWLPLSNRQGMLTNKMSFDELENFQHLRTHLLESADAREKILPDANFLLFAGGGETVDSSVINPVLSLDPAAHWSCRPASWYTLCGRQTPPNGGQPSAPPV